MIDSCLSGFHHHSEGPEVQLALLENEGDNKNPFGQTALCPRSFIMRAVVKEWCSEVFYHSTEVICLKCGQPKTRCCCATGVFTHVSSSILLWSFPPIILFQFHSVSYLSLFCKWRISWMFVTSRILWRFGGFIRFGNCIAGVCKKWVPEMFQTAVQMSADVYSSWAVFLNVSFSEKFFVPLDLRCGFCCQLLKLFWHVAKVVVVFGLLSSDVEFEISLETLCVYVKLMLF